MRNDWLSPATLRQALPMAALALVVLALLLVPAMVPAGSGVPVPVLRAAILVLVTLAAWAFGLFEEPIATLAFFLLAVLFHVATPAVVFSGFASTAWWLVFGGTITGIAVQTTGFGQRIADRVFGAAGSTYPRAVASVALACVGLAFLMPSTMSRIMLLMPIVLAFADRLGLDPGRTGRTGLVLTAAAASYLAPTAILPANVPNTVLLGAAEALHGVKLTYGPYLLLHFPVLGIVKTALLVWLVCRLFPEPGPLAAPAARVADGAATPMPGAQRRLAVVLALALALFATDFLHGVSPAWVALGAGIACLLPAMRLVSPKLLAERANINALIYVAGFLGVGAVVADSGLGEMLSRQLLAWAELSPGNGAGNLAMLAAIGAVLGLVTTLPALPAVLTPLAGEMAAASGLPLESVLMLQVVVFSSVLLPYQVPPIMVAMHLGQVGIRDGAKLFLAMAALTVAFLLPLDYLWWRLLGYAP